jgi:very-short-patch-repair endonuclease
MRALVKTALDVAIKEACGVKPEMQKTAQENYIDAVKLIKDAGLKCSVNGNIATKKDIIEFLKVPEPTLNSFLRRQSGEIKPISLNFDVIKSLGIKSKRLNGYNEEDVAKIVFGMHTKVGIKLKERMFGNVASYATPQIKSEIQWREVLSKVFKGFNLKYNYPVGKYKVDFFVPTMGLCLECNGYDCHSSYDKNEEKKREKVILKKYALIRFHHKVNLETLFNAILIAEKGKSIKLYDVQLAK